MKNLSGFGLGPDDDADITEQSPEANDDAMVGADSLDEAAEAESSDTSDDE